MPGKRIAVCKECNKEFTFGYSKTGQFCSNECNGIFKSRKHKEDWYAHKLKRIERATVRKYLSEDRGYKCEVCGISEWQDKKLTLHVDHIDGNPGDDRPENMRLLCPNCHSQTDFLGNANKGRGRKSQGLPLR
jgi:5-methylcytosine-specific restriction endonuclease McrA